MLIGVYLKNTEQPLLVVPVIKAHSFVVAISATNYFNMAYSCYGLVLIMISRFNCNTDFTCLDCCYSPVTIYRSDS